MWSLERMIYWRIAGELALGQMVRGGGTCSWVSEARKSRTAISSRTFWGVEHSSKGTTCAWSVEELPNIASRTQFHHWEIQAAPSSSSISPTHHPQSHTRSERTGLSLHTSLIITKTRLHFVSPRPRCRDAENPQDLPMKEFIGHAPLSWDKNSRSKSVSKGRTERQDEDRNTGSEMPLFQKAWFSPKSFYPFEIR